MELNDVNEKNMSRSFGSVAQWLDYLEGLHPATIALGLERVREVWQRLRLPPSEARIITVGGTNGKGSSVAMLEAILTAAGYRVGSYTSPHLLRFHERIRLQQQQVTDQPLLTALEAVERARGTTPLTYFEFTTLAALWIFHQQQVAVMLLEVGLGGRLDAVNLLDPDAALLTSIGLDHTEWLGETRDAIAIEKAGIYRPGRVALYSGEDPPPALFAEAERRGVTLGCAGRDYWVESGPEGWSLHLAGEPSSAWEGARFPLPALLGRFQLANAAGVVMLLYALRALLPVPVAAIRQGLAQVRLAGRFQYLAGQPAWLLDVAHNAESAQSLVANLVATGGVKRVVFSMLRDKPVAEVVALLAPHLEQWYLAPLEGARGLELAELEWLVRGQARGEVCGFTRLELAFAAAAREADPQERVLVCGSFHTVAAAMAWLGCENQV